MDVNMKRDLILDNYQNPSNMGLVDESGYVSVNSRNESCVDNITVQVKIEDEVLKDIRFDGDACAICTSSASVMTKELMGKDLLEADEIIDNYKRMIEEEPYNEDLLGELNIYNEIYKQPSRKRCATLAMDSLKKIVDEEKDK